MGAARGNAAATPAERGQAMTEYLVLLFGCMLGLIVLLTPMRLAVRAYMNSIYFFVSLPLP